MNTEGINLIKEFEGFRAKAYIPVKGDVPTIGYGTTKGVRMGDTITPADAETRLRREVAVYEASVRRACTVAPNENQLAAMTSLAYNIGVVGFQRSSVLRAHNRGDFQSAARAFSLWNKSSGVVYAGLTRRRAAEASLYLKPVQEHRIAQALAQSPPAPQEPLQPMPQRVDEERPMVASEINRAGIAAGATAATATVAQVADTLRTTADVKTSVDILGTWVVPLLLIVVVGLCAYIVRQRVKQRKQGWS